jgi:hypothetical protein
MIPLLAMAAVVASLSIAAPASATDYNALGKQGTAAASVKTASAPAKRHWSRYRFGSWWASRYHYADTAPAVARPASWSSRPFVLMVGIAF